MNRALIFALSFYEAQSVPIMTQKWNLFQTHCKMKCGFSSSYNDSVGIRLISQIFDFFWQFSQLRGTVILHHQNKNIFDVGQETLSSKISISIWVILEGVTGFVRYFV